MFSSINSLLVFQKVSFEELECISEKVLLLSVRT